MSGSGPVLTFCARTRTERVIKSCVQFGSVVPLSCVFESLWRFPPLTSLTHSLPLCPPTGPACYKAYLRQLHPAASDSGLRSREALSPRTPTHSHTQTHTLTHTDTHTLYSEISQPPCAGRGLLENDNNGADDCKEHVALNTISKGSTHTNTHTQTHTNTHKSSHSFYFPPARGLHCSTKSGCQAATRSGNPSEKSWRPLQALRKLLWRIHRGLESN